MKRDTLTIRGAFALLITGLMFVVGCPAPPAPTNQAPTADAGGEQTVSGGSRVTLDGSGSSDPEGGSLSYQWTLIAGPTVTLEDAGTAQASFIAPNEDTTLRFSLSVEDEAGATDTESVNVVVTAADNVPPIADAGDDQTVSGGEVVVLDGNQSFDNDGDVIAYEWVQTEGASVTLADSDTASPSFTAANEDDELTFELTVDDGNGHTDSDAVTVTVVREPLLVLVVNFAGDSIVQFEDLATKDGDVEPAAALSDPEALLDGPIDMVMNRDDWLIVANRNTNSLNLYLASSTSDEDQAPRRVVQGGATLLDQPTSMAYDPDAPVLYVSNTGGSNDILVFPGPSDVIFDGDLPPLRVMSSTELSLAAGIALDGDGALYVANTGASNILVFENAAEKDGDVTPERIISNDSITDPIDVLVDDSDTLYVVNSTGVVFMFANASTLDGDTTPTGTLTVSGTSVLSAIAIDAAGVGYLLDSNANAIYLFDDFATLTGERSPDRTISGDLTQLDRPTDLWIRDP